MTVCDGVVGQSVTGCDGSNCDATASLLPVFETVTGCGHFDDASPLGRSVRRIYRVRGAPLQDGSNRRTFS